jgi:hypothetical protein
MEVDDAVENVRTDSPEITSLPEASVADHAFVGKGGFGTWLSGPC